jgi:spore maturation protein CgeB
MRVFYAADTSPNALVPDSRLWYTNLYLPLVDLGCEVVSFDYDLSGFRRNLDITHPPQLEWIRRHRPRLEENLYEQVKRAHAEHPVDLFFSYFYSAMCSAEVVRAIGDLGIPTANWYCNGSYQLHLVADIAPAYTWCLVPERFRLDDYRRMGANPIYMQEAANPTVYHPREEEMQYDLAFVGTRYGDRPSFVSRLAAAGLTVHVFGPGWADAERAEQGLWARARRGFRPAGRGPVSGPTLSDEEMVRLYSQTRVSLGFSSCGETHSSRERILQVRLRDFEAPMSGAFYMVEYMDELAEFFEPEKEMVFYRNADELVDKAKYYLNHEAERERIRLAGHRRALNEHTWQHRFAAAFQTMGLRGRMDPSRQG